ncbi:hypothetical protein Cs7R123_57360 [Catellatospora sp. TT07R-123]|uniref:hypothetical protein n=1 Tax=Catellatospora sp. TT07R-123 TaxID=2733863 RepID=UPI001B143D6F|nr:hypothetical protein [Catellatospora sp. TT07R-123]GHJ48394.1 hypothetical protein Cs7R123_57360 [Catellatospora sp. TT07R-123]
MKATLAVRAALASLLVLGAAGCAQAADGAGKGSDDQFAFPGGDTVALRVEQVGGFVPPAYLASRIPMLTVYADGRVITEGPVTMIYPGPALPNIQVRRISSGDVQKLVDQAVKAGIGTKQDLGQPGVTDMPDTVITVHTADGDKKTTAYALNEEIRTDGLSADQVAARRKLLDLVKALTDLDTTLGKGAVGQSEPYQAKTVAGLASTYQANPDAGKQAEVAWPGPALPGKAFSEGLDLGCVAATGDQATAVLAAAAKANQLTPWTSGGKTYSVAIRPLLPDEADCAALAW